MTPAAPGVRVRHAGEPRAPRYRKKPEPHDEFHIEAADESMREVDERKAIGNQFRKRR